MKLGDRQTQMYEGTSLYREFKVNLTQSILLSQNLVSNFKFIAFSKLVITHCGYLTVLRNLSKKEKNEPTVLYFMTGIITQTTLVTIPSGTFQYCSEVETLTDMCFVQVACSCVRKSSCVHVICIMQPQCGLQSCPLLYTPPLSLQLEDSPLTWRQQRLHYVSYDVFHLPKTCPLSGWCYKN